MNDFSHGLRRKLPSDLIATEGPETPRSSHPSGFNLRRDHGTNKTVGAVEEDIFNLRPGQTMQPSRPSHGPQLFVDVEGHVRADVTGGLEGPRGQVPPAIPEEDALSPLETQVS